MAHGLGKLIVGFVLLLLGLYLRVAEHNPDGGLVWPLVGVALIGFGGFQWRRASLGAHRQDLRIRSHEFSGALFVATVAALSLVPILSSEEFVHSYLPYFLLRIWMVGFAVYGARLSTSAGGLRSVWIVVYAGIGGTFGFVWGLEAEQWWSIDYLSALLVALSAAFLRTVPRPVDHAATNDPLPPAFASRDDHGVQRLAPRATQSFPVQGQQIAPPLVTGADSGLTSETPPPPPESHGRTAQPRHLRMPGPPAARQYTSRSHLTPDEAVLASLADAALIDRLWKSTLPPAVSDTPSHGSGDHADTVTGVATVCWTLGLCGDRSAQVVKLAMRFRSVITIQTDDTVADAKSIVEVMMLAAAGGTPLQLKASGPDAAHAVAALVALFRHDC